MSFPAYKDVEIPLLRAIADNGGELTPQDSYPIVARSFPELTSEEQQEPQSDGSSDRKWWNMVRWARQHLVDEGAVDGSTAGLWRITEKGRARLRRLSGGAEKERLQIRDIFLRLLDHYDAEWNRDNKRDNPFFRQLTTDIKRAFAPVLDRYGLRIKPLGGQSTMRRHAYISLPLPPHKTSKGIYPIFVFPLEQDCVQLFIGVADENRPPDDLLNSVRTELSKLLSDLPELSKEGFPLKSYKRDELNDEVLTADLMRVIDAYFQCLAQFDAEFRRYIEEPAEPKRKQKAATGNNAQLTDEQIQKLVDAFLAWYASWPEKDAEVVPEYQNLTEEFFKSLSNHDLADFFFRFAHDGGKIQSGGERTAGRFKESIEADPAAFKRLILEVFQADFDLERWWTAAKQVKGFGPGIRSIFLHRVFPNRFAVLNQKAMAGYRLLGLLPARRERGAFEYGAVIEAAHKAVSFRPEQLNFWRADKITHFLCGTKEGADAYREIVGAEARTGDETVTEARVHSEAVTEPATMNPAYTVDDLRRETGASDESVERWLKAIERKGQAIFYGPPGTGKTYLCERLAKHLISEGDGLRDIVQFHPSYAYEEFIEGIRPTARSDGRLDYQITNGRFVDFCRQAAERKGRCVLIIDEINRAHLSRVFGELMYLLEYRGASVCLPSGKKFQIPANVRILGTMNTADRSIALVDHALRRRFAFISLYPDYDVLERYHAADKDLGAALRAALEQVNREIGDPNYYVGISFFMQENLNPHLKDVWKFEIEPYLEEFFFDQTEKMKELSWERISARFRL